MAANRYQQDAYPRQPNDLYPTPSGAAQSLLDNVRLRGPVWEACAGRGDMAKVIAAAGYRVVATDLVAHENPIFPIVAGVDALEAPLPPDVRSIMTNPPFGNMPHKLLPRWLDLLEPVGGQLVLLLRVLWGECDRGQNLTTRHVAYAGKLKTRGRIRWFEGTGGSPKEEHAWFIWDWRRDPTRMPFDVSVGDARLKGCEVCGAPMESKRRHAVVCSTGCRVTRHRRRALASA